MKVADLIDNNLDYWVGRAEGVLKEGAAALLVNGKPYFPSSNWAIAGPIIEREAIHLGPAGEKWFCQCYRKDVDGSSIPYPCVGSGPTPLIAAMRAYVSSKFGDTVTDWK